MPDLLGTYVIALTVNNGSQTDTNTVTISTTDAPPTANAGANQTVAVGSNVTLNGTKSSDVNSQPLSYSWSFVTVPNGSAAFLSGIRSPTPSFIVDKAGSYIAGLVVNDGTLSSSQSTRYDHHWQYATGCSRHSYAADRYRERPRATGRVEVNRCGRQSPHIRVEFKHHAKRRKARQR